jgi:hypothetical protein
MPCDLVVDAIILPSTVSAPCPTPVEVRVRNLGPDPASYPISVCLWVLATEETPLGPVRPRLIEGAEGQSLAPNQTASAMFNVTFPCQTQSWLRAEADCHRHRLGMPPYFPVPGNLATNPSMTIPVMAIALVPWLFTELRVGLQDTSGAITFDPAQLCANQNVVVDVTVANRGCGAAGPSETELTIAAPAPQGPVASVRWPTGLLTPGATASFRNVLAVPAPAPAQLTFRACADVGGVVAGQCNTSGLCRATTIPVSSGAGSPLLTLVADAPVRPGETPSVTWEVRNDCSDLGSITAEVSFAGTRLHPPPVPIPIAPLASHRESNQPLTVPATANALWLIGSRQLDLRVTGTGANSGPFNASGQLQVIGEPVAPSWWSWPSASFTVPWTRGGVGFSVLGTLTNRSTFASMTPSAVDVNEHLSTDPDASNDVLRPADTTPFPSIGPITGAAPAVATLGLQGLLSKTWEWIHPVTFAISGPLSQTWEYTAVFTLVDQFGNRYPAQTSPTLSVTVSVSAIKVAFQGLALTELILAGAALAAAAVALRAGNPIAAGSLAVAGSALWGLAIWHVARANDPPVPDFQYDEPVNVVPAAFPFDRETAPESLLLLFAVIDLVERTRAAYAAMVKIHAKILGAHVDSATQALQAQRSAYEQALTVLRAATEQLPNAAGGAAAAIDRDPFFDPERLTEEAEGLRRAAPSAELEDAWRDAGLPDEALRDLQQRMAQMESLPSPGQGLLRVAAAVQRLADAAEEEATDVLAISQER